MPSLNGVPTVCTAYQLAHFPFNGGVDKDVLRRGLIQQLNDSRKHLKVCVFALLTMQQSDNFDVLEELGFVRTFDAHNYKYPATSTRLVMYTRDMNTWEIKEPPPKKSVNPFHVPTTAEPTLQRDAPEINLTRTAYHDAVYHTPRVPGIIRRQSVENFLTGEFPVGVWVDCPIQGLAGRCPDLLQLAHVEVQLRNGGVNRREEARSYIWHSYETQTGPDTWELSIIRVRRLS